MRLWNSDFWKERCWCCFLLPWSENADVDSGHPCDEIRDPQKDCTKDVDNHEDDDVYASCKS